MYGWVNATIFFNSHPWALHIHYHNQNQQNLHFQIKAQLSIMWDELVLGIMQNTKIIALPITTCPMKINCKYSIFVNSSICLSGVMPLNPNGEWFVVIWEYIVSLWKTVTQHCHTLAAKCWSRMMIKFHIDVLNHIDTTNTPHI